MEVKSVALVGVAGAAAALSFQDLASAYTNPRIYSSTLPSKCSAIAERESNYISSSKCTVSRAESAADFELTELVRMVEFSNARGQKEIHGFRQSSRFASRPISPPSRLEDWTYSIKGSKII